MALKPGQLIEDENLINEILANKKKEELNIKYNILEGDELPDGALKNEIIANFEKENKIKEDQPSAFETNVINFYKNNLSGSGRTEYPNMGEILGFNTNWKSDLKLNIALSLTPDSDARLDIITKTFPGTVISKDEFDNIILTLPDNVVDKGKDRTFYLDKPGISAKGTAATMANVITYIPGAGWVSRNVATGVIKKIAAQGAAASLTGAAQDVGAALLGSEQNMNGIPVIDDAKLGLNFAFGAGGEKISQLLARFTGVNKAVDVVKSQIPSRFNIFSGSGKYLDNKGKVTDLTIKQAKKLGVPENVIKNKELIAAYAQALEDGLESSVAANVVGLNEWGVSTWLAQATKNTKVLKEIELMRTGGYGERLQLLVQTQDDIQLKQTYKYLTQYRDSLLKNKDGLTQAPPTTQNAATKNIEENLTVVQQLVLDAEDKMAKQVAAKYNGVDLTTKLNFKKAVLKNFTYHINKAFLDVDNGIGQALDKTLMPQSFVAVKRLDKFMSLLNNKNLTKITMGMLETERKALVIMGKNTAPGVDKAAFSVLMKRFDVFYDDAVTKGLASGDEGVLASIKAARKANTDLKKTFSPQNIKKDGVSIKDKGGEFVAKLINGENRMTKTELANYIYGNASSGGKSFKDTSIQIVQKLNSIFKEGTDGRQLIKDGAFLRIMENSFTKKSSRDIFDPVKFVNSVEDAFNGKGKDISKEIFTKQEMKDLMAFALKMKDGIPRKDFVTQKGVEKATNIWNSSLRTLTKLGGFSLGDIQGMLAAQFTFDAATKSAARTAALKEIEQVIFKVKIPRSYGGAGFVDQAVENRTAPDFNDNSKGNFNKQPITYGEQTLDNSKILEQMGIIESLNKYR